MKKNLTLGVIFTLIATFAYALQTALVKAYAAQLPLPLIVFMQSVLAFAFIFPFVLKKGLKNLGNPFTSKRLILHIFRAIGSLSISYLLFIAVQYMPLVNAMLLTNTAPLIMPLLAYLFLKQKINHRLWVPLLVGFIGIALVLHPQGHSFHLVSFLALGAAISMAATMLMVRKLADTESTDQITVYFFIFSSIISGIVSIPFWMPISAHLWFILFAVGGFYFLVQYFMASALRYANAQLVGSLFYATIVYSAIIAEICWHTHPSSLTWMGILLTIIGGILCIRAEYIHNQTLLIEDGGQYAAEKIG